MKGEREFKYILERADITRQLLKGTSSPIIGSLICDDAESLVSEMRILKAQIKRAREKNRKLKADNVRLTVFILKTVKLRRSRKKKKKGGR